MKKLILLCFLCLIQCKTSASNSDSQEDESKQTQKEQVEKIQESSKEFKESQGCKDNPSLCEAAEQLSNPKHRQAIENAIQELSKKGERENTIAEENYQNVLEEVNSQNTNEKTGIPPYLKQIGGISLIIAGVVVVGLGVSGLVKYVKAGKEYNNVKLQKADLVQEIAERLAYPTNWAHGLEKHHFDIIMSNKAAADKMRLEMDVSQKLGIYSAIVADITLNHQASIPDLELYINRLRWYQDQVRIQPVRPEEIPFDAVGTRKEIESQFKLKRFKQIQKLIFVLEEEHRYLSNEPGKNKNSAMELVYKQYEKEIRSTKETEPRPEGINDDTYKKLSKFEKLLHKKIFEKNAEEYAKLNESYEEKIKNARKRVLAFNILTILSGLAVTAGGSYAVLKLADDETCTKSDTVACYLNTLGEIYSQILRPSY